MIKAPLIVKAIVGPIVEAVKPNRMWPIGPKPILNCQIPMARPRCCSETFSCSIICCIASKTAATPPVRNMAINEKMYDED